MQPKQCVTLSIEISVILKRKEYQKGKHQNKRKEKQMTKLSLFILR